MALSQAELQKLQRNSLVKFFGDHKTVWEKQYKNAYEYAGKYITELRQEDVIEALVPALQVTPLLVDKLLEKKLVQRYWPKLFADLIVDSLWPKQEAKK